MSHAGGPPRESEAGALAARRDALRQAASAPGAQPRAMLDAALAELDAAIEALGARALDDEPGDDPSAGALHAERRLLRALFQDAPVPLFLLEPDGTVRRLNRAAGELLDTGTGYATGKPFTAFVNLTSRAALHTHLTAAVRTGTARDMRCELLARGGIRECALTVGVARLSGDADRLIIVVNHAEAPRPGGTGTAGAGQGEEAGQAGATHGGKAGARRGDSGKTRAGGSGSKGRAASGGKREAAGGGRDGSAGSGGRDGTAGAGRPSAGAGQPGAGAGQPGTDGGEGGGRPGTDSGGWGVEETAAPSAGPVVAAMTRRLDLVTAVTRLLLENVTQGEAMTLRRCAELLSEELSAWVILDVARGHRLQRQFVVGPEDQNSAEVAREAAAIDPQPGSLPYLVYDTASSRLIAHAEDAGLLGAGPGGMPLLMLLQATSALSVPLTDGERGYGALTLARDPAEGHFDMAELGLVEELGEQIALTIKMGRTLRRHTQITAALRASLLPPELPAVPGVEIATVHVDAGSPEMGGDFYDVYRTVDGWGLSIGDVGGRGEGVAAVGAAARHAIRVLARNTPDPATVLTGANEIMQAEEFGGRFVTACTAHMRWHDQTLRVTLGSAGHPGPLLVRPDGRVQQARGGGLPLGIFPEAELSVEERDLSPGDVLLLFTDGLADVRNPDIGYFGDRLAGEAAALAGSPPRKMLARLQELALEFSRGALRDDITVVAFQVGEPPAP